MKVPAAFLVPAFLLLAGPGAAHAETKCESKVQTCNDVRVGPRVCTVTICKDELGNIISTDILVLKDAPTEEPKKRPLPRVTAGRDLLKAP